jgi:peptidoglycan/xylan/chitin deacetylase (PgdA/CDA1 family)
MLNGKLPIRFDIKRYEIIITGCILLLSGAVMPSYWDPPNHAAKRVVPAPEREKLDQQMTPPQLMRAPWVALTFDDGHHPGRTERLLDVLRAEHITATFFVVGKMAQKYPELVQAIDREGHEVANHSFNHPNLSKLPDEAVLKELDDTRLLIKQLTGKDNPFYRPPGGDYNKRVVRLASRAGYRMILWSVLTDDVDGASPRTMRLRILRGAQDGGIVLMHSGIETTVETLPNVIQSLKERGFRFVTVSELVARPTRPVL